MRLRYGFIHFTELPKKATAKTKIWGVYTNDGGRRLGIVRWSTGWRRYWFEPGPNTGFDAQCLTDLTEFVSKRTLERKEFWKNAKNTNKANTDSNVNRDSHSP